MRLVTRNTAGVTQRHTWEWVALFVALALLASILSACGATKRPQPSLLIVDPQQINYTNTNANTYCSSDGRCAATFSLRNSGQSQVTWSASGQIMLAQNASNSINVQPGTGKLAVGQSEQVQITLTGAGCPSTATITFVGSANTATVEWECSVMPQQ